MKNREYVRFSRRFEDSSVRGYVQDIGPKFFLITLVSDRIWFDGFECFRIGDAENVRVDPHTHFVETALVLREAKMPSAAGVSVANIRELLLTAGQRFPLVSIHREEINPHACHIGRVVDMQQGTVSLREISPDATWDDYPTDYNLEEITRVSFGGDYEDALHLVGGNLDTN
jgi:hypothetical protein